MSEGQFLNVDLELESKTDLSALADHFGDRVYVLYNGRIDGFYRLSLETGLAVKGRPRTRDITLGQTGSLEIFSG